MTSGESESCFIFAREILEVFQAEKIAGCCLWNRAFEWIRHWQREINDPMTFCAVGIDKCGRDGRQEGFDNTWNLRPSVALFLRWETGSNNKTISKLFELVNIILRSRPGNFLDSNHWHECFPLANETARSGFHDGKVFPGPKDAESSAINQFGPSTDGFHLENGRKIERFFHLAELNAERPGGGGSDVTDDRHSEDLFPPPKSFSPEFSSSQGEGLVASLETKFPPRMPIQQKRGCSSADPKKFRRRFGRNPQV